jgi:sigma-54 dependent transcriptional regulator, acetoin dehydrogenase operon transcriptional activator AcoR
MADTQLERSLRAWERFFATADVQAADVRDEILRSWKRCHEAGLDPLAPAVPLKQNRDELSETLKRNGAYIEAASPFMRFLGSAVRGTGFILVLTDAVGIVLETFGDEDIICRARENNFVPGSCRAEEVVGTCSIGLAIIERKPVQLTGPEHYNLRHHVWTCASAPVFSPAGIFLGTATLSGVCSKAHPHTLGMVISAADAIQNRLRERRLESQKSESERLSISLLKSMSDAIVTIDSSGQIVYLNKSAELLVGFPERVLKGCQLTSLFSAPQLDDLLNGGCDISPFEAALEVDGRRSYLMIKPLVMRENDDVVGAVLALSRRREFLKNMGGVSGFAAPYTFADIVGRNSDLRRQIELATMVAKRDSRVLIIGETGTGKELIAQGIHNTSTRANGPFIAINCAALPRELIESELLGYKDGAFTGARRGGQAGKLELADGGTLFLDEIAQIPVDMQAKLLRVLQDGIVTRLGDTKAVKVDVRIIAATNERLFEKSQRGEFRADLYFRLSVVEIVLPPLRERGDDIDLLVHSILDRLRDRLGQPSLDIDDDALARLRAYRWPGNIRELENVLETAAIMSGGVTIDVAAMPSRIVDLKGESAEFVDHRAPSQHFLTATAPANNHALQGFLFESPRSQVSVESSARRSQERRDEDCSLRDLEAIAIRNALQKHNCNVSEASRSLGISRSSIYRKMRGSGIVRTSLVN